MSGPAAKGAKQRVRVYQTGPANYAGPSIRRNGLVDVDERLGREDKKVLIGLRIKSTQSIPVDGFKLFGKKAGQPVPIPLVREAPGGLIATQLQAIAGDAGEQWIGFEADYDKDLHGRNGFTTELQVDGFTADENGFQAVPIAFTYKDPAGNEFKDGHYIAGTSILPGSNADPEPPPEHPVKGATKKKSKKSKKKYSKKKGKGKPK